MPAVCFYFQVHQPYRVGRYSHFDSLEHLTYFDEAKNDQIMKKVAEKCYLPMNNLLLRMIDRYPDQFKVSFAVTGVAIEQMEAYAPEVLKSFQRLAETGQVEFIGETYYHSLAALYSEEEFKQQVTEHSILTEALFGQRPQVFRNTELIYDNRIAKLASEMGFQGVIAEGVDDVLGWRSPNFVYEAQGSDTKLLLKNYRLSDDIAFRFSNQGWKEWPLTTEKFANWTHQISGNGEVLNLFMDYETFGEHQWASTGIFDFMWHLPEQILAHEDWCFLTPSEVINRYEPKGKVHFHRLTSWADMERDLTAWRGNKMQQKALHEAYSLEASVRELEDEELTDTWKKLLTSDHFYYMCTKFFADGDVHAYFSPFESPYDAFVNYMNVLKDFRRYLESRKAIQRIEHSREQIEQQPPLGIHA
ncbi:alpha-amylase [bacterium]|nr:alpha-amylase [bacterium]